MMNLRWGAASAVFLLLPLLGHGQSAYGQANGIATDPTVLAECDFDPGQSSVMVPFTVDGKRLAFALATHDHTFLGSAFVTTLKRMPAAFAAAVPDSEDFAMRRAPRVSVGQVMLQFPFDAVRCGKLIYFGSHLNSGAGVIGLDALIRHVIEIDFDASKIRILQSVTESAGERFEMTSWREKPRRCAIAINARCGDEPEEEFSVELESPHGIYLNGALYRQLVVENDLRRVHIESAGGGRKAAMNRAGFTSSPTGPTGTASNSD